MSGTILVEKKDQVAMVTIDNQAKRNALSQTMWISIGNAMAELSNDQDLRCIVFRGAGEAAFGSGADIDEFEKIRADKQQAMAFAKHGHRAMHAVRDCPVPTLAAIRGVCVGGGMELAAFCDIRICSDDSRFGIPIARLGATLAYAELQGLIQVAGHNVALELLLEGRIINAQEAYTKGIVNRVIETGTFEAELEKTIGRISEGAPLSARWHKKFVKRLRSGKPLDESDIAEGYACFDTEDYKIGYQSFIAKKLPWFIGR